MPAKNRQIGASVNLAHYRVEYRSDLTSNVWLSLTNWIPGNGGTVSITEKIPVGSPPRFYRISTP